MSLWQAIALHYMQQHFSTMLFVDIISFVFYLIAMTMMFPQASARQKFEYGVVYYLGSILFGLILLVITGYLFRK